MCTLPKRVVLDAVLRAAGRAAAGVGSEMKRGVDDLATIASIAPWLGLLIAVEGIMSSFKGITGDKLSIMAALAAGLADAITRSAWGLAVGILALCCYRYLVNEIEDINVEMRAAALELANTLSAIHSQS